MLVRRRVVEEVGVELAAQITEAALPDLCIEVQPARQTQEGEEVDVVDERLDTAGRRTEVIVHRRAGAAGTAFGDRFGRIHVRAYDDGPRGHDRPLASGEAVRS